MSKLDPNTNTPVPVTESRPGSQHNVTHPLVPVTSPLALVPVNGTDAGIAAPPALSSGPTAASLMHSLRRRWLAAVLIAMVGALAGVAVAMELMPAPYRATAMVNVTPPDPNHPVFQGDGPVEPKTFRENQEGI